MHYIDEDYRCDDPDYAYDEAFEEACNDHEITADDMTPDPDAVEVRIGCDQDAEAECPDCHGEGGGGGFDNGRRTETLLLRALWTLEDALAALAAYRKESGDE